MNKYFIFFPWVFYDIITLIDSFIFSSKHQLSFNFIQINKHHLIYDHPALEPEPLPRVSYIFHSKRQFNVLSKYAVSFYKASVDVKKKTFKLNKQLYQIAI